MATTTSTPQAILDAVGGAENITHLTHCATRLRFELKDASVVDKATVEKIPGVMGAVPQSGDRYQIIIGGAVQSVYNDIMKLPDMAGCASSSAKSDDDVKAAARAKARGKNAYVDAFFEYLSDAFRPLLPVLLGASLILALIAVLEAFDVVDTHAKVLPAWLVFTNTMWRSVFYFLPAMVAYNAAKKLDIDPWVGAAVVLALLTPEYTALKGLQQTTCTKSSVGSDLCTTEIFSNDTFTLSMKWSDYGGQVFLPLIMVPILALVYRSLKKVIPANVQMVFVPFFSFLVMVPVSAFLIGPFSLWLGNTIGSGLSWLNTTAPIVFAIFIPLLYPFLVPLGLHWPLNALQLANIAGPAHADFIQGPMGTWNFACFGATLGVLILTLRNGDKELRQTASGALAAGLFGGISEPSLYGIHLRFKRIYPLMLTGCAAGGLTIGVISWISGSPVLTSTFVFTSLLTIPVFHPTVTYAISIAVAFFVSAFMVVTFGYQSKEEKAAAEQQEAPKAEAAAPAEAAPKAELVAGQEVVLTAPLNGTVVALEDVPDPVFSSGAVGKGAGIEPSDGASIKVVAPADGSVVVAPSSGHAYGLALDNGLEILIHVGIDTVNLAGQGFDVKVAKGDRVKAGQTLVVVDRAVIEEAGYKLVTPVLVTNYMNFTEVEVIADGSIKAGTDLVKATK